MWWDKMNIAMQQLNTIAVTFMRIHRVRPQRVYVCESQTRLNIEIVVCAKNGYIHKTQQLLNGREIITCDETHSSKPIAVPEVNHK